LSGCALYTPENYWIGIGNFMDKIDVYVCAHFFGWWGKMIIIRDIKMCIFLSAFFEFLELTFRFWLPNFYECWWDSIILDVFGCNLLGIVIGYYTLKIFNMKKYEWFVSK
jgi:phosphatidylserine synthase 2